MPGGDGEVGVPIYVLRCQTHGEFEVIVPVAAWPKRCPRCDERVERVPTAASARFVGDGFHVNDYPKVER